MSRAREWDFHTQWCGGGLTFYPYQLAFGFSLRYWPCLFAPSLRIHIGPAKAWLYIKLAKVRQAGSTKEGVDK